MKSFFKGKTKQLGIKKVMKIERELEQNDTKRMDLKRVLLRFEKQHMLGFRLECNPPPDYVPPQKPSKETNFMKLIDRKFNNNVQINEDMQPVLKEMRSKYCPLYELKFASKVEDIDTQYSFVQVATIAKHEHNLKLEKIRMQQQAVQRAKQREIQAEIDKRAKLYETTRAKNLEDIKRMRELKIASTYKLNSIEEFADIVDREANNMLSVKNLSVQEATKAVEATTCKFKRANYHLTKVELDLPGTAEERSNEDTDYEDDHFFKSKLTTPIKSPSTLKKKKLKDKKNSENRLSKCTKKDKHDQSCSRV